MSDRDRAEFWAAIRTVSQLKRQEKMVSEPTETESSSPLIVIQSGSLQKKPLFMVPGIVGEGEETTKLFFGFARIAYYIDEEQPFYTFQPWGVGEEANSPTVEAIAATYIQAIRDFQSQGPYLLGGECIGGVIALEMAQQLTAQGSQVDLLFLLDTRPPDNEHTILNYQAQPYLGRTVFLATEERLQQNPISIWSQLLPEQLEIQTIPGNRSNYIRHQAPMIGEKLRTYLNSKSSSPTLEPEETFVAPRDELELQLTEIWEKVLGIKPIGARDNFFDLGGHSLLAVTLFAKIEQAFHTSLALSAIFQAPTIEQLANVLRSQTELFSWYSLVPIQPGGSRSPLFGIHYLLHLRTLSPYLGSEQPIYGLRYGVGEPAGNVLFLPSLEDLAAHYIKEMQRLQPAGPYYLMGHSIGGLVAYEMAQQLDAQGQQVALLVLFDTQVPSKTLEVLPLHQRISSLWRLVWILGLSQFLNRAKVRLRKKFRRIRSQYFPHIHNPEHRIRIQKDYKPKPYPGHLVIFQAMNPYEKYRVDPSGVGWQKLLGKKFVEIHEVPGSHVSILEEPNVQILAKILKNLIDNTYT
jgi:thioesterase domain-containing protein/acyl carrier protein